MTFFRQYLAPFLILLTFLVALLAVSARIFLPSDMAQPAPIAAAPSPSPASDLELSPALSMLVNGLPDDRLR